LNEATFVPPSVDAMNTTLDALEKYLHTEDDLPPLVRLALIHYQFEAIHPFIDGNGRIGRLLISLLSVHWNLLPLPLLYLSAFFEHHRDEYYDLLMAVSTRGGWREWVAFFLRGVAEQARDAVARAKRLQDLETEWRQRLIQARTSALVLRLVEQLFQSPYIAIPQAQKLLKVTYPSAQRSVERLVKLGVLKPVAQAAYGKMFVAPRILDIVNPSEEE
jgi:Fic family protein